jgi:hypothetical protein
VQKIEEFFCQEMQKVSLKDVSATLQKTIILTKNSAKG